MSYYTRNNIVYMMSKPYDVHAAEFILAHQTSTGQPMGFVQKNAINNRYLRYKNILPTPNGSNLWNIANAASPLPSIWIFAPINDSTANALAYRIEFLRRTAQGAFTNFVSGDFTPTGVIGGTTKRFSSGYAPNVYPQDNIGYFAYVRREPSLASSIMGANESGNANRTGLISDLTGTGFRAYVNNTALSTAINVVPTGLIGTQRGSSTYKEDVKNGVVIQTEALASVTPSSKDLFWFARNNNNFLSNTYNGGEISAIFQAMPYLTTNELADLYWIEQLYQTEIITGGRQV